ncbi:hypothetical protein LWF01_15555 [Saxibacter everestensis]|uniref:Uncharacterized protein n=1 Tax=Saxibacter everestensis TaxID=2909229 RepID=A0ABY8QR64_9MICO|nr:hypothetical protein LWF01_15555 [Brevibacteriaceae bacterium ZFBP1038]
MSKSERATHRRPIPRSLVILIAADALILLLPPMHWAFGNGNPASSVGYFLCSGFCVMASLFAMFAIDRKAAA